MIPVQTNFPEQLTCVYCYRSLGRACLLCHRQSRIGKAMVFMYVLYTCVNVSTFGPSALKSLLFEPSCHLSTRYRQDLPFKTGFCILRPNLRISRAVLRVAIAMLRYSNRVGQQDNKRRGMIFLARIKIDQRISSPETSVRPVRNLVSLKHMAQLNPSGLNL